MLDEVVEEDLVVMVVKTGVPVLCPGLARTHHGCSSAPRYRTGARRNVVLAASKLLIQVEE
jgi:hypothetical protein